MYFEFITEILFPFRYYYILYTYMYFKAYNPNEFFNFRDKWLLFECPVLFIVLVIVLLYIYF